MRRFSIQMIIAALSLSMNSSFSNTLGQITLFDPRIGTRSITYEPINHYAISEGDIILGKLYRQNLLKASILSRLGGGGWSQGIIPFELDEQLPIPNKLATLQAIMLWQQKSNIKFIELTSKNRDKYPDYLSFIPARGTTCASYVGKQKGRQVVLLAPRCNTMNTVHEIGHALGLWHEQSRADRDLYIRIAWENIDEDHRYNFEQHLTDGRDFGEYDYDSIMHYPPDAFSKNGEKTIIPLKDNIEIGQRRHLTEKDIAAINAMYPSYTFPKTIVN